MISENEIDSGLMEDIGALGFNKEENRTLNPRIARFYEHKLTLKIHCDAYLPLNANLLSNSNGSISVIITSLIIG